MTAGYRRARNCTLKGRDVTAIGGRFTVIWDDPSNSLAQHHLIGDRVLRARANAAEAWARLQDVNDGSESPVVRRANEEVHAAHVALRDLYRAAGLSPDDAHRRMEQDKILFANAVNNAVPERRTTWVSTIGSALGSLLPTR